MNSFMMFRWPPFAFREFSQTLWVRISGSGRDLGKNPSLMGCVVRQLKILDGKSKCCLVATFIATPMCRVGYH